MITKVDVDFKEYIINTGDLIKELGISKSSGYRELNKALLGLQSKVFTIPKEDGPLRVSFLSSSEDELSKGVTKLCFDPKLKPYLLQLTDNFTTYEIKNVLGFTSQYSYRLYEVLRQHLWKKKIKDPYIEIPITLVNFKYYLHIEENKLYGHIKRHIIFSQKELKDNSDIHFTFKEIKKGREVDSLLFKIYENTPAFPHEPIEDSSTDLTSLPNQIWSWIYQWEQSTGKRMTIFDREQSGKDNKTMSYLNLLISKLSESKVKALWNEELAKSNPNPINLLTKTFPAELFKLKQNRL